MIKIGNVSLDTSHPRGFAMRLEENCMDMKYEYTCNLGFRGPEETDWFVNRFGLAGKMDTIEEMVPKVDIGFIQSCNWEKHLDQAMPFLEAGKPVFIDKPLVGSVRDLKRIRELAAGGAKILGSSSARYAKEVQDFLKVPVESRGQVVAVFGTCGVDEFNYGIHVVEILTELAGTKGIACKFVGTAQVSDTCRCETFQITFENGVQGTYQIMVGRWMPFHISIMTTKGVQAFTIDSSRIYLALLQEIYRELTKCKSILADIETILNCTEIMLCGKKSRDVMNGEIVTVAQLEPEDKFDGFAFEAEYGSNATAIYKD